MTALHFGEYASSSCSTSISNPGKHTSTNTGTAPNSIIGLTAVGKPTCRYSNHFITSLDSSITKLRDVRVYEASRFAEEPEFVTAQCLAPNHFANLVSNL